MKKVSADVLPEVWVWVAKRGNRPEHDTLGEPREEIRTILQTADAEIAEEVRAGKYEPHTALAVFMRIVNCVRRFDPALAEQCYPHTTEIACLARMAVPAHPEGAREL